MSRSYKKHPWCGDKKGTSKKRVAWKAVRQYLKDHPEETLKGGRHKKIYETWEICDYCDSMTWEEYWAWEQKWAREYNEKHKDREDFQPKIPNEKECYRDWFKYYKRK